MPTGVDKQPVIKQHFDAIEDHLVVEAITKRLQSLHDAEGSMYHAETFTAKDADPSIAMITEACAAVYKPGLTHEQIWKQAQIRCANTALAAHKQLLEINSSRSDSEKSTLRLERYDQAFAAFAMYTLDRHSDESYDPHSSQTIDRLLDTVSGDMSSIMDKVQTMHKSLGMVAIGDNPTEVLEVSQAIEHRKEELEQINFKTTVQAIKDAALNLQPDEKQAYFDKLSRQLMQIRLSKSLTNDQYDAYLEMVTQLTHSAGLDSSVLLSALPQKYLLDLYEQRNASGSVVEDIIERYIKKGLLPRKFLGTLHRYFPGGIAGEAAKSHLGIQRLLAESGDDFPKLIMNTLPIVEYTVGESRKGEVQDYNSTVRSLILAMCKEVFQDDDFATHYQSDLQRCLEPRIMNDTDNVTLDIGQVFDITSNIYDIGSAYDTETLRELHESFDLASIDILTKADIDTMLGLKRGDERIINNLRSIDLSLIAYDVYGDHNGGPANSVKKLSEIGRVLVPWRRPSDLYRTLTLLKSHDIKFCRLIIAAHGDPGLVSINKDVEHMLMMSEPAAADPGTTGATPLYINQSAIGRIARDYMQAPVYAEVFNMPTKKSIIYTSCYGDVGIEAVDSVAEATARKVGKVQSKIVDKSQKGKIITRHDGIIDTQVMGTAHTNFSWNNDPAPGLALYGPQRDEAYSPKDALKYKPNMILLTPSQRTFVSKHGSTTNAIDIEREPFNYRIFA